MGAPTEERWLGKLGALHAHAELLITHLQCKIDEKSRLYEDEALQNIFLMKEVKDLELETLLGDNWIRKRHGHIRQYSMGYLRSLWTRVLACLRDDGFPHTMGSSSALKGQGCTEGQVN